MPGVKGKTNNPGGRPPKGRAIAERLSKALSKTYLSADGKKHKGLFILAEVVVDALIHGEITLPNGKKLILEPKEWFDLMKFTAVHLDGPAKSEIDMALHGKDDGPITIKAIDDYRNLLAPVAPRSMEDSATSGQDENT